MGKYRIGNDITVVWTVNDRNGDAYPLSGKDIHLYYTCEKGRYEAEIQIQDSNKIVWEFVGSAQKVLGGYSLTLEILQSNGKRSIKKDMCNAFTFVGKDCEADAIAESTNGDVAIYQEVITTNLDVYRIDPIIPTIGENTNWFVDGKDTGKPSMGKSAYIYAKENGYEGTEEEFAQLQALTPGLDGRLTDLENSWSNIPFEKGTGENSAVLKGGGNTASEKFATAEGENTAAFAPRSHAEGYDTVAVGSNAHAEGEGSVATGTASHAEGYHTITGGMLGAHAQGKYNNVDYGNPIHTIGIGTSESNRKNALEVSITGEHYILGVGGYDGINSGKATDVAKVIEGLATKQDLADLVDSAPDELNTLNELAEAIKENENIVDALNQAITKKVSKEDVSTINGNSLLSKTDIVTPIGYGHFGGKEKLNFSFNEKTQMYEAQTYETGKLFQVINGGVRVVRKVDLSMPNNVITYHDGNKFYYGTLQYESNENGYFYYFTKDELYDQSIDVLNNLYLDYDTELITVPEYFIDKEIPRKKDLDELSEQIEENEIFIKDLLDMKIDKEADDYYPQLSVGLADNLAGVDVVEGGFTLRRSGGGAIEDGVARVQSIKGNSVVWNQLVKNNLTEKTISGVTFTPQSDGGILVNGTASANSYYAITDNDIYVANHKVFLIGSKNNVGIMFGGHIKEINVNKDYIFSKAESFSNQCVLFVKNGSVIENVTIYPIVSDLTKAYPNNEPTTIEEFYARIPQGVNLNEYSEGRIINMNVDSLKSVGFNQWDEEWEVGGIDQNNGELTNINNTIRCKNFIPIVGGDTYNFTCTRTGIRMYFRVAMYDSDKKFIGSVQYGVYPSTSTSNPNFHNPWKFDDNASYIRFDIVADYGTTYNHDICINLSDAEKNGTYEPYISREQSLAMVKELFSEGMRSAGSAHDEIRFNKQNNKWEKREIKQKNMWELNWSVVGSNTPNVFHATIADIVKPSSSNDYLDGLLCSRYAISTKPSVSTMDDMSMLRYNGYVYVKDSSCADIAELKSALQDIILYYEPSGEEWVEIDDTFNLDYEVWNGGTEQVISKGASSPLKAEIAYGFNAVGKIKELEEKVNNGVGGGVSKEYVDNAIASAITNELNGDF